MNYSNTQIHLHKPAHNFKEHTRRVLDLLHIANNESLRCSPNEGQRCSHNLLFPSLSRCLFSSSPPTALHIPPPTTQLHCVITPLPTFYPQTHTQPPITAQLHDTTHHHLNSLVPPSLPKNFSQPPHHKKSPPLYRPTPHHRTSPTKIPSQPGSENIASDFENLQRSSAGDSGNSTSTGSKTLPSE